MYVVIKYQIQAFGCLCVLPIFLLPNFKSNKYLYKRYIPSDSVQLRHKYQIKLNKLVFVKPDVPRVFKNVVNESNTH